MLPIPSNESALRYMETGAARTILDDWFAEAAALIAEGWLPAGFSPSEDRESGALMLRKRRPG